MSKQVERYQNPAVNDDVRLRLFTYNSNNLTDLVSVDSVDIYYLDRAMVTEENKDGRRLVESFTGSAVTAEDTGTYLLPVTLTEAKYVVGTYIDSWSVTTSDNKPAGDIEQVFHVYPDLWYTTPIPVVYDFDFAFQPNKMRKGSKQFLRIEIKPNVPTAGALRQYYENLAIVSDLKVSLEMNCGPCLPAEQSLRLVVDDEAVSYREKRFGFYQLDTTDMECGIYDIWFKLEFGGNVFLSDRMKFQVFD